MPSIYTGSGIELIGDGEQSGSWGTTTNTNLQIINRLVSEAGTIALSGTTHTLTISDGTLSDGQYAVLVFGGSPSGTNTVTISPNDAKRVFVVKNSSGQSVILTQGSGGNVTVLNGKTAMVYCDGAGSVAAVVNVSEDFVSTTLSAIGALTPTDGNFIVGNGSTWVAESGNTVLQSLGVTATAAELNVLDGITATTAELNYTDGVTSNIQTQLDGKQPLDADLTAIGALAKTDGNFIVGNGTTWVAESGNTALQSLGVTATAVELNTLDGITASTSELNYLNGVTSAVQTQINGKADTSTSISAGAGLTGGGDLSANRTISHADTSSQGSVNNSGNTFIQDITVDGFGHITAIGSGTVSIPVPSALSTASGSAPSYSARAWVSFAGPTTIRGSGNVSSVTSLGTGVYGVNFSTAMPDANYAAVAAVGTGDALFPVVSAVTTTSTTIRSPTRGDSISNSGLVSLIVCR